MIIYLNFFSIKNKKKKSINLNLFYLKQIITIIFLDKVNHFLKNKNKNLIIK